MEVAMKKKNWQRSIVQYLGIIGGAILMGIAYTWFLAPYKIVPGGVGGLSQILFYKFDIPLGLSMLIFNIPLFIISFIFMGTRFGWRSIYGMLTVSILTDLVSLPSLHKFGLIKDLAEYTYLYQGEKIFSILSPSDIYLSAITGSVLLGMGLGIIFRFRGSTGGTDIPVAIIKQKTGLSIGTGYWIVETLIILTVGLVFRDIKIVIWGYVNLFISAKMTDLTSEGLPYVKGAYIISPKYEEIKEAIYDKIHRGVTYFKATGGYTGNDIIVLFCVMNRRQVSTMRELVKDIDPKAFVILTDVNDVMGYGFKSRNLDLTASE
ncbi:MAG: YitT family protein [Candidatus Cloacimonetes bacterium]|nr:YitT family protein [Candidatus Cloacimonadota bacterium]